MKKESIRKPNLRFPGFSESWEKTTLGDLLTFKNGLNAGKEDYGDGEKFINVLDIIQNNFITHDKIIGSVKASEKNKELYKVEFGDVLFQRSSETREEVGQANVYLDKEKPALFGGFVIRGKKKSEYDPVFINHLLKTPISRQEITSKSGGSTRYNVGQETLSSVEITIAGLPEQQKIASFLSSVDERIELMERKKEKLEAYKKGVMQQIFSQQIRFKQDDGSAFPDWEEKRLGEVCEITTGKLDANAMVPDGEYRFYTCAKEFYRIDKYAFDKEALLISGNGANVGYIHYYKGKFNAYQRTYVLTELKQDFHFVKYFLDKNLHKRIHSEKKDGNTPYIVMNTLTDMKLQLPNIDEQKKIAAFLNSIDANLETLDSQIQGLRTWKKGLLQQMFV